MSKSTRSGKKETTVSDVITSATKLKLNKNCIAFLSIPKHHCAFRSENYNQHKE